MKKYIEVLNEKHLPVTKPISQSTYSKMKKELSEDDFNQRFLSAGKGDNAVYFEVVSEPPADKTEMILRLLDKILEQQGRTSEKLNSISSIIILWLVLEIIALVFILMRPF